MPVWVIVLNLAVHRLRRADDLAAERLADGLMSQADAEQRDLAGRGGDQVEADAGFGRRAGAGRQHDRLGLHGQRVRDRQLVVAPDLAIERAVLRADIAQEVVEVEGKAVVVVDEKNHGPGLYRRIIFGPAARGGQSRNSQGNRVKASKAVALPWTRVMRSVHSHDGRRPLEPLIRLGVREGLRRCCNHSVGPPPPKPAIHGFQRHCL